MMAILYLVEVAYVELPISFPHPWRRSWPSPLPMALPSLGCASKVEISNSPNFFLIADCANLRTFGLARSKTKGWNQVVRPLAWMKSHRGKAEEGPTLSTISWGNHVSRCQHELEPGSSAENAHLGQQCFQWNNPICKGWPWVPWVHLIQPPTCFRLVGYSLKRVLMRTLWLNIPRRRCRSSCTAPWFQM